MNTILTETIIGVLNNMQSHMRRVKLDKDAIFNEYEDWLDEQVKSGWLIVFNQKWTYDSNVLRLETDVVDEGIMVWYGDFPHLITDYTSPDDDYDRAMKGI